MPHTEITAELKQLLSDMAKAIQDCFSPEEAEDVILDRFGIQIIPLQDESSDGLPLQGGRTLRFDFWLGNEIVHV